MILYLGNRAWEIEHEKSVTVYGGAAVQENILSSPRSRSAKENQTKIKYLTFSKIKINIKNSEENGIFPYLQRKPGVLEGLMRCSS